MITFKNSEVKIKDYDKYYSDNLNFLESNLNKKIFSYLTSDNKFDACIEIIDEFYKCTDTDSKTYKTLVSFLFSRIGIRNNLSRSGDVNLRSDLLLCDSYQAAIVDIEKGSDLLSPPRNILEQNAIFTSRFKIKNCNNFIVVTNSLPRTFPQGISVEIFSFDVLEKAWNNAKLPSENEQVTPYIYNHQN